MWQNKCRLNLLHAAIYLIDTVIADDRDDAKSQNVLKELENIDDEADEHDLPFIKIDDDQASYFQSFGLTHCIAPLNYIDILSNPFGASVVSHNERGLRLQVAKDYGIEDELPCLVYFENEVPSIYHGDLTNEEQVLDWLIEQINSDSIEEVTDKILENLVEKNQHVAVIFCECAPLSKWLWMFIGFFWTEIDLPFCSNDALILIEVKF